jgi:hypothetical protein
VEFGDFHLERAENDLKNNEYESPKKWCKHGTRRNLHFRNRESKEKEKQFVTW